MLEETDILMYRPNFMYSMHFIFPLSRHTTFKRASNSLSVEQV